MIENNHAVYTYTRKDAIADGYQVEVPERLRKDIGLKCPVFITRPIYDEFTEESRFPTTEQSIRDLLIQVFKAIKAPTATDARHIDFDAFTSTLAGVRKVTVYASMGAKDIDDPTPALTIMSEMDV